MRFAQAIAIAGAVLASAIVTRAADEYADHIRDLTRERGQQWHNTSTVPYGGLIWHSKAFRVSSTRQANVAIVRAAARKHGVPEPVAVALIRQESGFNPRAHSYQDARGLGQILPSTWREEGCSGSMWDPSDSADCAMQYLAKGIRTEGSISGGLAWYHGGPNHAMHGRKTRAYQRVILGSLGPYGSLR